MKSKLETLRRMYSLQMEEYTYLLTQIEIIKVIYKQFMNHATLYFNKLYHLIFIKGQRGSSFKSSLLSFMFSKTPGI